MTPKTFFQSMTVQGTALLAAGLQLGHLAELFGFVPPGGTNIVVEVLTMALEFFGTIMAAAGARRAITSGQPIA